MTTVMLPWPPRQLSPNARVHRQEKAEMARKYRHACGWEAKAQRVPKPTADRLHVDIVFCPPDNRRRDLDNMLSSIKSGLDGLAAALGVDDYGWKLSIERGATIRDGRVLVTIEPIEAETQIEIRGKIR